MTNRILSQTQTAHAAVFVDGRRINVRVVGMLLVGALVVLAGPMIASMAVASADEAVRLATDSANECLVRYAGMAFHGGQ